MKKYQLNTVELDHSGGFPIANRPHIYQTIIGPNGPHIYQTILHPFLDNLMNFYVI